MKTKPCLTLEDCKKIGAACEAEARKNKWNVVIAVLDDGGHLLWLERMDGATPANAEIAIEKGRSAAVSRRTTKNWEDRVAAGRNALLKMPVLPVQGGVPIMAGGECVGAVGVSCSPADQVLHNRSQPRRRTIMSLKSAAQAVAAAMLAAFALNVGAQQPNPLDNVPDKMPNDFPYGAPISLDRAEAAINAAVAESRKRGWKLNVAVVDSGGNLVAFQRMDGAQLASIAISEHKARASATFRRETKALEAGIQGGNNYLITLDGVIGSRGGIPLLEGGKLIGAIGCSGGTGSQDEVVCKAGAATVK